MRRLNALKINAEMARVRFSFENGFFARRSKLETTKLVFRAAF